MPLSQHLFSSLDQTADVAVRTVVAYLVALALFRLAGRRTLAQFSAFDILVTVAAGTVVGSTALPSGATVSDGITVLVTLLLAQVLLGAARLRSEAVRRLVDFTPLVVFENGRPSLTSKPWGPQMTESELAAQLRRQGVTDLSQLRLAVLEPTGKLSVLGNGADAASLFTLPTKHPQA